MIRSLKRVLFTVGMLIGILAAMTGCGGEELLPGIDGYVWVPGQIGGSGEAQSLSEAPYTWTAQTMPRSFQSAGEWLYYVQITENGNTTMICRIPWGETLDFSRSETMVSAVSLGGYTVDKEQNLYYYTCGTQSSGSEYDHITLYRQSPEKEILYEISLEETVFPRFRRTDNLAVGAEGDLYFLESDRILRIDGEGKVQETALIDNYRDDVYGMEEYLLASGEGILYYVNVGEKRRVWECGGRGKLQFKEIQALQGRINERRLYRNIEGLLVADSRGDLFQYRQGQDTPQAMLRWEDSDLFIGSEPEIMVLDEEKMLLLFDDAEGSRLYLLSKTPAEELPEKERLVLASLFPTAALRQAVVEFNRQSEEYHVSIESYGADAWYAGVSGENEGAYTRLDAAMSSGTAPDILDLAYVDIYKYTEKDALEDLSPYLEGENLGKEDFLENLLESFTIEGKLVSIPKYFRLRTVAGRATRIGEESGWTMEELMELTAGQEDIVVVNGGDAGSMVEWFLTDYYRDAFIDWEKGESSFDDAGFGAMMEWVQAYVGSGSGWERGYIPSNMMLVEGNITGFQDYLTLTERFQEKIVLKGYPSVDGRPVHRAEVMDELSIPSRASHKEGAWEFLYFYLSRENDSRDYFSTRKSILQAQAEDAATPWYACDSEGNPLRFEDGSYSMLTRYYIYVGSERIGVEFIPQEQVDALLKALEEADFTPESMEEKGVVEIVAEEAAYYFDGTKPLDEVVKIIQSRVNMLIQTGR